jgi:hypothetical protein
MATQNEIIGSLVMQVANLQEENMALRAALQAADKTTGPAQPAPEPAPNA